MGVLSRSTLHWGSIRNILNNSWEKRECRVSSFRAIRKWWDNVPYMSDEGKMTLREIKVKHHLSTVAVAAIASVEPSLVYWMEQGGALSRKDVEQILGRLSKVTGQHYSLETVGGYWLLPEPP